VIGLADIGKYYHQCDYTDRAEIPGGAMAVRRRYSNSANSISLASRRKASRRSLPSSQSGKADEAAGRKMPEWTTSASRREHAAWLDATFPLPTFKRP
jgi:hypothetical protein